MSQLRIALRALALVPIVTGLASAVGGSGIVPGGGGVSPSVESELRFFSIWWVGLGLYLWSLAPRLEERGRELRVACGLLFAGGLARLWAIADVGRPDGTFVVLMVVEWVVAVGLVLWHARAARA
jgi:hypothetical protein